MFPRPTANPKLDKKNSQWFPHSPRGGSSDVTALVGSLSTLGGDAFSASSRRLLPPASSDNSIAIIPNEDPAGTRFAFILIPQKLCTAHRLEIAASECKPCL